MTVETTTRLTPEEQQAILQWPEQNDISIFPADTKNKKIWLSSWQDLDFSNTDFKATNIGLSYNHRSNKQCKVFVSVSIQISGGRRLKMYSS